jgi:hypothetical protein
MGCSVSDSEVAGGGLKLYRADHSLGVRCRPEALSAVPVVGGRPPVRRFQLV